MSYPHYYMHPFAPVEEGYYYNSQFTGPNDAYSAHHDQRRSHHDRHASYSSSSQARYSSDSDYSPLSEAPSRTSSRPSDSYYYYETAPTSSLDHDHQPYGARDSTGSRHSSTDSSSKQSLGMKGRVYCDNAECLDEHGRPTKFFSRKADVARHDRSAHNVQFLDCPKPKCARKGRQGFTRQDHLIEHLRGYHQQDIPKRAHGNGNESRSPGSRHSRH